MFAPKLPTSTEEKKLQQKIKFLQLSYIFVCRPFRTITNNRLPRNKLANNSLRVLLNNCVKKNQCGYVV